MEEQVVKHYTENGKYRIKIEKAAGVKTGDGFTVEANGDTLTVVREDVYYLYDTAKSMVASSVPVAVEIKSKE